MKEIHEVVDLPSVTDKPMLHPLDVAAARLPYLASWWLRRLASPSVVFLLGVVLWMVSETVVTAVAAPIVVLICAALAAEYHAGRAWEHLPRRRHAHRHDAAVCSHLAASFIDAVALVSGLLLLIAWASTHDLPVEVELFTIGAGAGIVLIQLGQIAAAALRSQRFWVAVGSRTLALTAVAVAVVAASTALVADPWNVATADIAVMGALTMIVIQLACWLVGVMAARRRTPEDD